MELIKLKVYKEESDVDGNMIDAEMTESFEKVQEFIQKNGFTKIFPFA